MALDIEQTIELLTETLLARLGDEVDLIFQYGSFLKGSAHRFSDLDISYVPVHETTGVNITVMVAGVLIDLYPMSWTTLESMAGFDNVSSTVLLENNIVYQRSEEAAERFHGLSRRLDALRHPAARPEMLRKAQQLFRTTSYELYLLRTQCAAGQWPSCLLHAQHILNTVLHLLAVCNQAVIDTRKMAQVLALPRLPVGLAETVERITMAGNPDDLLLACENLLRTTRELLLAEQREVFRGPPNFPAVFDSFYPELKADLQKLLLAYERKDRLVVKNLLVSMYHETCIHLAQATTGLEYSSFNSLAEYKTDLVALGFPDLMSIIPTGSANLDSTGLADQVQVFDRRLREFLSEHAVELNDFATLGELKAHLLDA